MIKKSDRFHIIVETLAGAEELHGISLPVVAAAHGITVDALKALLDLALYCEFRDGSNRIVQRSDAFLVTEDDTLMVTNEHWLRDLDARAPEPADALRLFIAGLVAQSVVDPPDPALDPAMTKLASVVAAGVYVDASRPQHAALCEQAWNERRVLHIRYFSELDATMRERDVEPGFVGSKWRNWYMVARPPGTDEVNTYRVDRILAAALTDVSLAPLHAQLSVWVSFDAHARRVRLRLRRAGR